jgi:hypothetical protein
MNNADDPFKPPPDPVIVMKHSNIAEPPPWKHPIYPEEEVETRIIARLEDYLEVIEDIKRKNWQSTILLAILCAFSGFIAGFLIVWMLLSR